MGEKILQYVWQVAGFGIAGLKTTDGRKITLINQGEPNPNAGPDFLNARLGLGYEDLAGDIEIHAKSGEWYRHRHHKNPHYNTVVLHVVWESDQKPIIREDGTEIPELILNDRINPGQLALFDSIHEQKNLPCGAILPEISNEVKISWIEKLGIQRLQEKANIFNQRLKLLLFDWNQLLTEEIANSIGGPINGIALKELLQQIPWKLILQNCHRPVAIEAFLFGMAGFLTGRPTDNYQATLKDEWLRMKSKYLLEPNYTKLKKLRMRPASFPELRIAQFASLLNAFPVLSELLLSNQAQLLHHTEIKASEYWDTHTQFGKEGPFQPKTLGREFKNLLLINTLIPLSYLYFYNKGKDAPDANILQRLRSIPPEENTITRDFREYGVTPKNALQSQGLIELHKFYCKPRRCLECEFGVRALRLPQMK